MRSHTGVRRTTNQPATANTTPIPTSRAVSATTFPNPIVSRPVTTSTANAAAPARTALDGPGRAADGDGASAQGVHVVVEDDPAAVQDHDVFEQVGDLVDQVAGEHDRARVLGVVGP